MYVCFVSTVSVVWHIYVSWVDPLHYLGNLPNLGWLYAPLCGSLSGEQSFGTVFGEHLGEMHAGAHSCIVRRVLWHELCLLIVTWHYTVRHIRALWHDSVLPEKSLGFIFVSSYWVFAILYTVCWAQSGGVSPCNGLWISIAGCAFVLRMTGCCSYFHCKPGVCPARCRVHVYVLGTTSRF